MSSRSGRRLEIRQGMEAAARGPSRSPASDPAFAGDPGGAAGAR